MGPALSSRSGGAKERRLVSRDTTERRRRLTTPGRCGPARCAPRPVDSAKSASLKINLPLLADLLRIGERPSRARRDAPGGALALQPHEVIAGAEPRRQRG